MTATVGQKRAKHRHVLAKILLAGPLLFGSAVTATVIGGTTPAWAQSSVTLYVASGGTGDCSSQANACGSIGTAIATATGGSYSNDDVTIDVGVGTYTETDTINASSLNSLAIAGAGASTTTVDGGGTSGPLFTIVDGTVAFSAIAVDNGYYHGYSDGAGIDACDGRRGSSAGDDCVITVTDSNFVNDRAVNGASFSYGGAIAVATDGGGTGSLTVTGSTFTNDYGQTAGGGIDVCDAVNGGNVDTGCDLTVTGSTFTGDSSFYGAGAINSGGNPYGYGTSSGTASITDSTFTNNSSVTDGAITSGEGTGGSGSLTVTDSTFSGNTAGVGGAIANASSGGSGTATVTGSTFADNTVGVGTCNVCSAGGAISNAYAPSGPSGSGTLTVSDSTFVGNQAENSSPGDGGAIENGGSGMTTVTSSTFSDNSGASGGAIANDGGTVDLGGNILASASGGGECAGGVTDLGYNIDDDGSCGFTFPGISASGTVDGALGSLANNGGPTQTIALEAGSPAIGLVTNPSQCPATDQRGAARSNPCDAGAYDTNGTSFNPSVSSVTVTGGLESPTVTVTGTGFGNQADLGTQAPATSCSNSNTGSDYNNFSFSDVTTGWLAGGGSNCTGVSITSYSDTQFTFTLGNGYGNGALPNEYGALEYGDSFQVNMLGATYNGTVPRYSPTPTISSVAITGNLGAPTVTVSGSGFGALADLGLPVPAYCGNTGSDYGNNFYLTDGWGAGQGVGPFGDCTGVIISSYSNTQITFTFGSGYGTGPNQYGVLSAGDSFQMNVLGATYNGTVPYPETPTIGGVTFGGDPTNPTVTVSGNGFGTQSDLPTPGAPGCSGSGSDYGNYFYFADATGSWQAGQGGDCTGVNISSYSATQITFTFGNQYSVFGPVKNGDSFSVSLFGVTYNGTASLGTRFTCTVSGLSDTTSFPVVVSEAPAPPASIDAGGTFSTAPAAQVTVPASVLNHFIGMGATSLTIASQTTALDGRTAVGGASSGAVNPNTEAASASDLPQSDTLVAGVPYTYDTTYNPVTWQTGPGTGKVYFTPGAISAEVTFVIHNTPTSESISCTPPTGVAALGSTTVSPPPATATFQVPGSTPPLQNQVTAGTDGGWGATIANTSMATVIGLSATVSVTDGGAPLSYDLAGMAASGTNCSSAGSGKVTCSIGNLAAGASSTLDVLVTTTGLVTGTSITGSATITSSNQTGHTSLGSIAVVVVQSGISTKAVAVPGIPVASTKKPLAVAKASIKLTLPTKKIIKPGANPAEAMALAVSLAATSTSPPPVAVTLESLAPSAEPALCPPTGTTKCEGNIIQAVGNFSAYTNKKAPIVAVLQFFYGLKVPAGTVYFLKPNGKTVDKLPACKKSATGFNTPCVDGPETTGGSASHDSLYAQDTVYFTGNDPAMGRR